MTRGIYPDELPEFPKVASRLKAFHATRDIASAIHNAQKLQVRLDQSNIGLGRSLFAEFNRHLLGLSPELDADAFGVVLQTVANVGGSNHKSVEVAAGVLCHAVIFHKSVAWFDLLAHHYPEMMLFKVFTNEPLFRSWVNDPNTSFDTLTKLAEFIIHATYAGKHKSQLLLALDPICSINPSIISRLSAPEFLARLDEIEIRDDSVRLTVSKLARAGLTQVASVGSATAVPMGKPKL